MPSEISPARIESCEIDLVHWYMEDKLNTNDLMTHTLPLDRVNEGFDLIKRGASIGSVVLY